jgi:pyrroloquinoline quinone biosynthesis protein D
MSAPAQDCVLRLAPGCRLNTAEGREDFLLIPEGALRLKGPARAIVELCDGQRAFREIVEVVKQRYPEGDPQRIETDVATLLASLHDRGVIEYV